MENYENNIDYQELRPVDPGDPAVRLHASQDFSRIGMGIFEMLLIGTAVQVLLMLLFDSVAPSLAESSVGMLALTFIPLYIIAMPIGIKMLMRVDAYAPEKKSLSFGSFLKAFCISLFMMYLGNMAGIFITSLINGGETVNPLDALIANDAFILKFIIVVIVGPIMEELIFRKLLIDRMSIYGERLAIVTSALLFGLFHGNISQFCYAFMLGLVWGYVYIRTGNIGNTMLLHMLVNFLGSIVAPCLTQFADLDTLQAISAETDPEKMMSLLSPGILAYIGYVMCLLFISIVGLVLLLRMRRRIYFEPAALELPREGRFRTVWLNKGMSCCLFGCIVLMVYSQMAMAGL